MSILKKNYSFSNKRFIWRLIPSESGYLVIEERNMESKEVFFNCLNIDNGKVCFKNFQLEEKFWIGIEAVNKDAIYFHKFRKPDMPGHKGIYAFDILSKKLNWQNDDLIFLLANDDKVFAYQAMFEGRHYYAIDSLTGEIRQDLGSDVGEINKLRERVMQNDFANNFLFPMAFTKNEKNFDIAKIFEKLLTKEKISESISWLKLEDLVMFNYHEKNTNRTFDNYFKAYDTSKGKIVLSETLNLKSNKLVLESFFVVKDLLFLLIEKTKLVVYKIIQ